MNIVGFENAPLASTHHLARPEPRQTDHSATHFHDLITNTSQKPVIIKLKMKEKIYLRGCRANAEDVVFCPLPSSCILFFLRYCQTHQFEVVFISDVDQDKSCSKVSLSSLHDISVSFSTLEDAPAVVKNVCLPSVHQSELSLVRAGLCVVLRHIIKTADREAPQKRLIDLLGFRQGSMRMCSEVSGWTKLCEVELPDSVGLIIQSLSSVAELLPNILQWMEHIASLPFVFQTGQVMGWHMMGMAEGLRMLPGQNKVASTTVSFKQPKEPACGDEDEMELSRCAKMKHKAIKPEVFQVFKRLEGHLGIVLAYLLPQCQVYLVENKEESLLKVCSRLESLELTNVTLYQCNIDYFIGKFDVGVCLHACGSATDMVQQLCLNVGASFVICPCCYGSIHKTHLLTYPRSKQFQGSDITYKEFLTLGHAADQTEFNIALEGQGRECMDLVDSDRAAYAKELGYEVTLCSLQPMSCTPKNNLLVGIPAGFRSSTTVF
ncbi:glutathione S-transferase C-terminal domain-containing protein [Elysia marginata]|uniref:Glutathione S-transferase C-terminal domain-containing protein n=1 Tax=Elysia marginata TaxID=1093978 RepID=A0AAV4F087_9GAST|nr:glutathione S-transferase C-terminal domain-containing protein [Elysia marginata]